MADAVFNMELDSSAEQANGDDGASAQVDDDLRPDLSEETAAG